MLLGDGGDQAVVGELQVVQGLLQRYLETFGLLFVVFEHDASGG